ncbi:MAG: hypothetical protein DMD77_08225 [Candidatus Rokuibacteriota bacterium]|nr:MAG: hypothetical protein DMD77_08225 [Candidatus Rokubacteria bacterium]
MIRALRLVLATLLPLGCASAAVAPPAAVRPPPSAPAPSALPPAPQVSPRVDNPQGAERDVQARLAHVAQVIDQIDPSKLASEQRQTLSSVQDFVTKATEALRAKDTARAKILADKASHLADDLALALKGAK